LDFPLQADVGFRYHPTADFLTQFLDVRACRATEVKQEIAMLFRDLGVAIVTEDGNYGNPIGRDVPGPWNKFDQLLAEPFIKGRELTVAVLGEEALAVTELKIDSGFYDYEHKYTDGRTVHECPANVPADIAAAMMDMAARAHRLLGCRGASRSDFRWDEEQGEAGLYLLEVNTQPGMTPLSLVPEQARMKGIDYGELVERLIAEALE
jgi:D-alanine-D-alanine ligase